MTKVYDKYLSSHFLKHNDANPLNWHWQSYDQIYGKYLPKNKNAKILDIGSGQGQFLYFLQKKGFSDFFGVDISKEAVTFCQKKVTKKVKLISDLKKFLKNYQNRFDLIVLNDVLEHFPKKEIIPNLELIYKGLKKDGQLFIKTPNAVNLTGLCLRYQDFTHEISFTENSLAQVLKIAGFENFFIFGPREGHPLKEKFHRQLMNFIFRLERGGLVNPKIFTTVLIAIAKK